MNRKISTLLFALILFCCCFVRADAQNVRYDAPFPSITSQYTTPFLVANIAPNLPVLAVCNSPANNLPCSNYATTYTSAGGACPNGSQDTPQPQPSACQATGDAQGNLGFWAAPGKYDYTVCIQNTTSCFGPYTVTLNTNTTLPLYLNFGTPTSQGNECLSVTTDTSGHSITAVAALRSIDSSNEGHDVACAVTADASLPTNTGAIVFPFVTAVGTSGPSQSGKGVLEINNTGAARLILTNTSGTNRENSFIWRSAVGGFGTDFRMVEDIAGTGNEDMTWIGPSISNLYVTFNCTAGCATTFANSAGTKQLLLSDGTYDAKTNPELALVKGHIAHGTTGSNADNWGTAACSTNTVTVTFATAFSNATYQVLLTDQTTAGGAKAGTKNTGSFVITCTGASDSVDYLVLGNPY